MRRRADGTERRGRVASNCASDQRNHSVDSKPSPREIRKKERKRKRSLIATYRFIARLVFHEGVGGDDERLPPTPKGPQPTDLLPSSPHR